MANGLRRSSKYQFPFGTLRLKWTSKRRSTQEKIKTTGLTPLLASPSRTKDRAARKALRGALGAKPVIGNRIKSIITLRGDESDPAYKVVNLNRNCLRQKAISIRASTAWIDTFKTPNGGLGVPFIDELGRFTGHLVYRWSCDPRSLISTVISTISSRIMKYARRHNKYHIVKRFSKALLGAAAYYAISKNSYFWDRVLFFSRNLEKKGSLIHRLRLFYSSKWDDNKRFVISQVIFQTNWLLFRVFRPRDKSLFFSSGKNTIWRKPDCAPPRLAVTNIVRDIAYAMSMV